MLLVTFLALSFVGGLLGVLAAVRGDKTLLVPMGGIFLLVSLLLLFSGSLEVQEGKDVVKKNVSTDQTNITHRPVYTDLDEKYSAAGFSLSNGLGLILIAISLYSFIIGYTGKD